MKKLLTALTIILALTLSGCGENVTHLHVEEEIQDYIKRNNDNYYTQEEVDELLEDYVSMEELDELFEDFGGLEQFINDFDNWEDIVNAHINE